MSPTMESSPSSWSRWPLMSRSLGTAVAIAREDGMVSMNEPSTGGLLNDRGFAGTGVAAADPSLERAERRNLLPVLRRRRAPLETLWVLDRPMLVSALVRPPALLGASSLLPGSEDHVAPRPSLSPRRLLPFENVDNPKLLVAKWPLQWCLAPSWHVEASLPPAGNGVRCLDGFSAGGPLNVGQLLGRLTNSSGCCSIFGAPLA